MPTFRTAIETTDTELALEYLNEVYPKIDLAARSDRFALHLRGAGDERLAAYREGMSASGWLRVDPMASFTILDTYEGEFDCESGRTEMDMSRPSLFPPSPAIARWNGTFSIHAIEINAAATHELAAAHFAIPGLRVSFTGTAPYSPQRERAWRATATYVRNIVFSDEDLMQNQMIRDSAFTMVAASMLTTFPNNTLDLDPVHDGASAVPASIRRAMAYMEERIAESISLEDIAAASRLSPRGLQDAFVRILGVSPTRYLRRMRLEAARADLQRADPTSGDTVSAIAHRWGFTHLARFAARYREEYSEYPADTLRN